MVRYLLFAEAVAIHVANALESLYDYGHNSNISDKMIISKYLDIKATKNDTSISHDESWSAFVLVNLFAFEWPPLCFVIHFDIKYFDSLNDWISNTCLFVRNYLNLLGCTWNFF